MKRLAALAALTSALLTSVALAQLSYPMVPGASGPMVPVGPSGGAPPPPVGCDGTIDLSTGCVQPMLGGL